VKTFVYIRYGEGISSDEVFETEKLPVEIIREFFEEWLEKSNGTGHFLVGNPDDIDEVIFSD